MALYKKKNPYPPCVQRLCLLFLKGDTLINQFFFKQESSEEKQFLKLKNNFQQRISWLSHRWRTQRNAIRNVNCRIQWIIESLNAHCALWYSGEHACLSISKHLKKKIFFFFFFLDLSNSPNTVWRGQLMFLLTTVAGSLKFRWQPILYFLERHLGISCLVP